jgi:fatty acid desaturase
MPAPMDPWFTPAVAPFFAFFALFSLLSLLEPFAKRGQYRRAVLAACTAAVAVGIALLFAAAVAYAQSQPPYVVLPLSLSGVLVTLGSAIGLDSVIQLYAVASKSAPVGAQRFDDRPA